MVASVRRSASRVTSDPWRRRGSPELLLLRTCGVTLEKAPGTSGERMIVFTSTHRRRRGRNSFAMTFRVRTHWGMESMCRSVSTTVHMNGACMQRVEPRMQSVRCSHDRGAWYGLHTAVNSSHCRRLSSASAPKREDALPLVAGA